MGRLRHNAGQRQDLPKQRTQIGDPGLLAPGVNLLQISAKGDGVDAEVLGGRRFVDAKMNLQGAAADDLADDLFKLPLQQVIGLARPET